MNYRMTQEFNPPFRINALIEEAGALRVSSLFNFLEFRRQLTIIKVYLLSLCWLFLDYLLKSIVWLYTHLTWSIQLHERINRTLHG